MGRRVITLAAAALALCAPAAAAQDRQTFEGAIHEHTAYSDGEPGTRPADAFAAVRAHGSDFMVSTEHSDTFELPIVTNQKCLSPRIAECAIADQQNPGDAFRKWDAIAEQADAATDASFVGVRGFEWTNDRYGHINVLFSDGYTNVKRDGSYVTMDVFWDWFTGPGSDALATFNHPGRREIGEIVPGGFITPFTPDAEQPGSDWDAFRHVPAADERMVGMELFNGGGDYAAGTELHAAGSYGEALDAGWHVGAIGAEDTHDTGWGVPQERKTVILAPALSRDALREALLARRFYAVHRAGIRMSFTADGAIMGARLARAAGAPVALRATAGEPGATLELVTSGGELVASGVGSLSVDRPASPDERWYFVRVRDAGGRSIAYSSPIWVTAS
jgi:hypothetical protein